MTVMISLHQQMEAEVLSTNTFNMFINPSIRSSVLQTACPMLGRRDVEAYSRILSQRQGNALDLLVDVTLSALITDARFHLVKINQIIVRQR